MRLLTLWLVLVGMIAPTLAQTNAPVTSAQNVMRVSLKDCIQLALEHNLGLKVSRYTPRLFRYALGEARGNYDPTFSFSGQHDFSLSGGGIDPDTNLPFPPSTVHENSFSSALNGQLPTGLTYELFANASDSYGSIADNSDGSAGITASQPLLRNMWTDFTRLTIRKAKNNIKHADLGLLGSAEITVHGVETAYYNLLAARENVVVQEKALQLADQLLAENKKRVEVGQLAPLDEKQAESQVAAARADLSSARLALALAENTLRGSISDNYREMHAVLLEPTEKLSAPPQTFDLQASWRRGLAQKKDLLQLLLDIENQRYEVRYRLNQLFPQFDLFGTYGHGASGSSVREYSDTFDSVTRGNRPFYTYGARVSIPLSNKQARESYKTHKDNFQVLRLNEKILEQGILIGIDNAVKTAQSAFERVDARRAAREYSAAALDSERKKLENGKSTSFIVLQLQRDLTQAASDEIEALAAYNTALADLALAEGSVLERHMIDFDVSKEISFERPYDDY